MTNIAINGLGRIGRAVFKIVRETPGLNLVAVNDIAAVEDLAYLLNYDSVYGRYAQRVTAAEGGLAVGGVTIPVFAERDPEQLPWSKLKVDTVVESTGVFTKREGMEKHIRAGARRVILSAPSKSSEVPTVVRGVNKAGSDATMISCASCTTNCITPVAEVVDRHFGILKATMTTIHAYTSSQAIVDAANAKDRRRGRAGAINLVPTTTGAARATTLALPQLAGKFDGASVRAPIPVGSLADMVFVLKRRATVDEVKAVFREEATSERYAGILGVSEDPLVSADIVQDPRASIVDLGMMQVTDGDLLKIMSWYDNEWGYANQLVREAQAT